MRATGKETWNPRYLVSANEVWWRELQLAVGRALDTQLIHPVTKRIGMEIQDFRRTLRPVNHSSSLLKGGQDVAALHFFQSGQSGGRGSNRLGILSRDFNRFQVALGGNHRHKILVQPKSGTCRQY